MRTVYWLFAVSVALFISGIAFVVAAARPGGEAAPAAVEALPITPVASVRQIMNGIVGPAASVVFESVSTIVSAEGVVEHAPQTEEEWVTVGSAAAALIEAGNLMMMGDRPVDRGEWVKMAKSMMDAGTAALKAADAKSADGILAAGEIVNESCDNCHRIYQRD
jgi:hypothetical protein